MSLLRKNSILLLLEGSYPYVVGGVSNWVQRLIEGFPEYEFRAVFLGTREENYQGIKYQLPENLVELKTYYLYPQETPSQLNKSDVAIDFEKVRTFHEKMHCPQHMNNCINDIAQLLQELHAEGFHALLKSPKAWEYITQQYEEKSTDQSFIDYYWTVKNMHYPLAMLTHIVDDIPKTDIIHTVSTGFAGFLGTLLQQKHQTPLLLTEHGIYTKERKIDLLKSEFISDKQTLFTFSTDISYIRRLWIRFFETLSKMCYHNADRIISLYKKAQNTQLEEGAELNKTEIIPNGIKIDDYRFLRAKRTEEIPQVVCFIGRIVPIKDVKTLIRAMHIAVEQSPGLEAWIVGSSDEANEYFDECKRLVSNLGLNQVVKFLGVHDVKKILHQVGVVVLSSISEGLPLVILESFAAGVPVISTEVGSCRQLILGADDDDRALGAAGELVPIAHPEDLAASMLRILGSRSNWQTMQTAAIQRVEKYYDYDMVMQAYQRVYQEAITHGRNRVRTKEVI